VQFIEELKQQIQAKPQKIRRNGKRTKQYSQNRRLGARTVGAKDCLWIKTTDVYRIITAGSQSETNVRAECTGKKGERKN